MLFNSYGFLLLYLPATLLGFFLLGKFGPRWSAAWLAAASLFFYGYWDYRYLPPLCTSIAFNYAIGLLIRRAMPGRRRAWLLALGVAANLGLLGYYKYADFFLASMASVTGQALPLLNVVLPVGISFFTFTQLAFLVDSYRDKVHECTVVHYLLFVTYFPHLIAGPILHHGEMLPQFADRRRFRLSARNFAVGASIFFIGLAKKVLIADNLGPHAAPLFAGAAEPTLLLAWGGALAYAFQLYFDFSAYSDMAIGLSRLFGVRLPLNFASPYKAGNIAQFWRRWHMTLSRFLRDYLYIPLGGNRRGPLRRHANLMVTMVLGGLWHGAGWNFVIWGALHGAYLSVHRGWLGLRWRWSLPRGGALRVPAAISKVAAAAVTFAAVTVAWVFFRAPDVQTAWHIVCGMAGAHGVEVPDVLASQVAPLQRALDAMGVKFYLGGVRQFVEMWGWVVLAATLAFAFPNTQQIMRRGSPALNILASARADNRGWRWLTWHPSSRWAIAMAMLALAGLLALNRPAEFLYFQF